MEKYLSHAAFLSRRGGFKFLLCMKLCFVLMLATGLQVSARGYGQDKVHLSLKLNNIKLSKALNIIGRKTHYRFLYSDDLIPVNKRIDLRADDKPLSEVLDKLLAETDLEFKILDNNVVVLAPEGVDIQARRITGTVKDAKGNPLIGVTVKIKGTQNGTTTDVRGRFSIEVPDHATLEISYVGYDTKNVSYTGQSELNIVLYPGVAQLNDIVVVGYGVQRKEDVTGAISTIDQKAIENRPVTNAIDALQGTAPGLVVTRSNGQPGKEGWNVNIRGFSSINGTNAPLVIVDGVEGSLSSLNPNDIASISVLKDAAATAIYGAKAASGVLIVTTKSGESGKISVQLTELFSVKQYYGMPERLHSWEEAILKDSADAQAGGVLAYTPQQIQWMKDDKGWVYNMGALNGPYYDLNQSHILLRKNSPSQQHNISISGGNDKTTYFVSLGYYNEGGIFKFGPDGTKRYNARINLTTAFDKHFSLNSKIAYTEEHTESIAPNTSIPAANGDYGIFYNIFTLRSLYPIFLPNSDDTKYAQTGSGSTAYPVLKDGGDDGLIQRNFDGAFTLKAEDLVRGLTLRAVYSPHLTQLNENVFARTIPLWAYDPTGTTATVGSYINQANSITKDRRTETSHEVQLLADYDKTFATNHHFHILGGFQYQYYQYDSIAAKASSLISNDIPSLNLISDPNVAPAIGDNIQTNAWISYFGRFTYSYKDKYLVEANIRNDASSRLAPGHRTQTFPGLSAGWVMSEEPWFKNIFRFIELFKLRGSYGKLGNAQLGQLYEQNYNYIAQLSQGPVYTFNNSRNISIYQNALPSPSLGWETIATTDGGIDIAMFNSRLTANIDYFIRTNNNMLITVANLPAVLGATPSTFNGASMRTKGWEFNVGWRDQAGDLSYHVNLNIDDNTNKITSYLGNVSISSGLNTAIPDYPVNSLFGYKAAGYFSSAAEVSQHAFQDNRTGPGDIIYQDLNGDQKINGGTNSVTDHGDLAYLGNTSPRYNFGINGGLNWKNIDFSVFFQGTGKRTVMIYPYEALPFLNSWRMPYKENLNYWTPSNTQAQYPRLYSGGTQNAVMSSFWAGNAAYIRLKNLQIGYTIPARITQKIKIEKARIFFSGENIWESTKLWYKYMDPENPNNSSFEYPFYRTYALGVNINF